MAGTPHPPNRPTGPTKRQDLPFKREDYLPFWWRAVPEETVAALVANFQHHGGLPALRAPLDPLALATLPNRKEQMATGLHSKPALLAATDNMSKKLNLLIDAVHPALQAAIAELEPLPVFVNPQGVTFWVESTELKINDMLEMQFPLVPAALILTHAYGYVISVRQKDRQGLDRVTCRFATTAPFRKKGTEEKAPKKPENIAKPLPPPPPPQKEEPEPQEAARESMATPAGGGGGPILPQDRNFDDKKEVVSVGRRANNRRQEYRVDDEVPLAWRVITKDEFDKIMAYFKEHEKYPVREIIIKQVRCYQESAKRIENLEKINGKAAKMALWFNETLNHLFHRANSTEEQTVALTIAEHHQHLLEEMTNAPRLRPKAIQLLTMLKQKFEIQGWFYHPDYRGIPAEREKLKLGAKKLKKEIGPTLEEFQPIEPLMTEHLRAMYEEMEKVDFRLNDFPADPEEANRTLITYPVNLSAGGVAFRTRKTSVVEKGDFLELIIGYNPTGEKVVPTQCYAQVMMIKNPDPQHRIMVACQTRLITKPGWEVNYAHIAHKQRQNLLKRIDVEGGKKSALAPDNKKKYR